MVEVGEVYKNKQGRVYRILSVYTVISRKGKHDRMCMVKFDETGYTREVFACAAIKRQVKDKHAPSVYNVGFLGDAIPSKNIRLYNIWCNMLGKCYNKNDRMWNSFGGAGVTVCTRWHSFEKFINDVPNIAGAELLRTKITAVLNAKDIATLATKNELADFSEFNVKTCRFAILSDKIREATSRTYSVSTPDGTVVVVKNLAKMCREHSLNLSSTRMYVNAGKETKDGLKIKRC